MDSTGPLALLKFIAPQIPGISYTALQHSLGLTNTSSKWDLRTAVTVHVLRNIMDPKRGKLTGVEQVQKRTMTEPGVKGKMWIANATMPKTPASDEEGGKGLRDWVFEAVDKNAEGEVKYTKPEVVDVEVEWTGWRDGAGKDEALPKVSEEEKYKRMMAEPSRTSEVTVLYFHGGAYYLCDPRTHRTLTSRLAKECGGRVCSVRYRLAPQTAFPGQQMDALLVYLSLLYPPEGSLHEAIPADKIVLGGDSAGGHMSFALLQLLLLMHRNASGVPVVKFHGRDVHVPLPAGCSANSGWLDISRAMPSITNNAKYDYLPPGDHNHDANATFAKDSIWPANPPRGDLFCDLSLLDHPMVALLLADWTGAPPLWMNTGEELLTDEDILVATQAAKSGVKVHFEQYEAMPHCFGLLLPGMAQSERMIKSWGGWARRAVEKPQTLETNGMWIPVKGGKEEKVDVLGLKAVEMQEARRLVREAKRLRIKGFENGAAMVKPAL